MKSRFFIDRPIFAWVVAIVIMLAGALGHPQPADRPVSRHRPAPGLVNAIYPGASAKTVEDSVTQVIEQKMKGLDGLDYMSSTSDSSGAATTTLTFKAGTNIDIAQVQVQNKLQTATALLPQEVQQQGLTVAKSARNFLLIVGMYSDDPKTTNTDLADYIASNLQDPLSRVDGVGDVQLFGAQYAMRIWLDPTKLASYSLTPADVIAAIKAQNAQVSAGQLGGVPNLPGIGLNATITAQSRLTTPAEFQDIIVKNSPGGAIVHLRDVARVELGAESYGFGAKYNGKPAGPGHQAGPRRQRAEHRRRRQEAGRATVQDLPGQLQVRDPLRLDAVREAVDRGSGQDPGRSHRAGLHRHVPVPAELARHPDPDHRRAGGPAGHLRGAGGLRLLDQHPDHVRPGAGHRPAGRRRHRRGRERRAGDERGRLVPSRPPASR
jgi:hypothetical protein